MSEETVITKTVMSADPQGDLLSKFLSSDDTPAEAQSSVKQAGGVPVELQSNEQEFGYESQTQSTEQQPTASQPKQPVKTSDAVPKEMSVPQDILKKNKIETVESDLAEQDFEEPIPDEVSKRGKKGVDAWTAAKREAKQYRQQVEELTSKIKELETSSASSQELESFKKKFEESEKQRQAVEDRLGQVDIAYSSQFKESYDKPIASLYNKSVKLLMQAGVDQNTAKSVVTKTMAPNNTSESIQDIVQDFPPAIQGALYQNALEMIEGQKRRASAIKDWRSTKASMSEQEQRATEARMLEVVAQNVDSAIDSIRNEGSWLYTLSETDDNWNQQVEERVEAVRGLMKSATPDVMAKYLAEGIASRTYRKMYEKQLSINNRLQKELQSRERVRPGLGGYGDDYSTSEPRNKPLKADDWLDNNLRI